MANLRSFVGEADTRLCLNTLQEYRPLAQRIDNLYRLVTLPAVYRWIQSRLRGKDALNRFLNDVVRAEPGMRILDVGCGPASILEHLPDVDYLGIDLNEKHIAAAQKTYRTRGRFMVGDASKLPEQFAASFDLLIVSALLHHLSDDQSRALFASLEKYMKPDARIITIDNVWRPRQRLVAKLMNKLDSGLNVRTAEAYIALLDGLPFSVESRFYDDLLAIPYDHFCMTLRRKATHTPVAA